MKPTSVKMPPGYYPHVIDVELERLDNSEDNYPASVVSGFVPVRPKNLPKFPNNAELVLEETNTNLLRELLPTLTKYKCLDFAIKKTRRSPWVRTFCDLYHPACPRGSNIFQTAPDITSKRKYGFKSYQIPTLFQATTKVQWRFPSSFAIEKSVGRILWKRKMVQGVFGGLSASGRRGGQQTRSRTNCHSNG